MKREILKEQIFKVESRYYNARFWIPEEHYSLELKQNMIDKFHELNYDYMSGSTKELADYFCQKYEINAVEITAKDGTGSVYYVNWP